MTFDTRVEDQDGWFTLWSGQHDPARVRDFDLYLYWRDGEGIAPPLEEMINLERLRVPLPIFDPLPLRRLTKLRALEVHMGNGEPLSPALFELTQLEELILSGNFHSHLPDEFHRLAHLRKLDVSDNGLGELPRLPDSLEELRADGNDLHRVRALPPSLKRLDVSVNPLEELELPPSLEELDLFGSPLLPRLPLTLRILRIGELAPPDLSAFAALRELSLRGQPDLARLPSGIEILLGPKLTLADLWRFPRLRSLDLSQQPLGEAPTLSELPTSLQKLNLSRSGVRVLPARLSGLDLRELLLHQNGSVELPPLPRLERLYACGSPLGEIPRSWLAQTTVQELWLEEDRLTHIPPEIDVLAQLRRLGLRKNLLRELPERFSHLDKLEELDLVANRFEKIPPVLDRMKSLRHVQVHANPNAQLHWG